MSGVSRYAWMTVIRLAIVAALTTASLTVSAAAQDNRGAYDVAVRCFVANVRAEGLERRAGRPEAAERYRLAGRDSFDAMAVLGVALGKTREQMEADVRASQNTDLPRMVSDNAYFRTVVSTCRAYGLMPSG